MRARIDKLKFSVAGLALLLALAPMLAQAETVEECVQSRLTRGSETTKRQELSSRCDNTSSNRQECEHAAKLLQQAIEAHQLTVREICEKQAASVSNLLQQNTSQKNVSAVASDAKGFSATSAAKLDATNKIATKGKQESEAAVNKVIDDPEKVKPQSKPLIRSILKKFRNSNYSGVSNAAAYAVAMKRIDESWKILQNNPEVSRDNSGDAYDATATYLNAEEVRLGTAYQRNQMASAAGSLQAQSNAADNNVKKSGESSFLSNAGKTMGLVGSAASAAGALSALAGKQGASPSLVTGAPTEASSISAGTTSLAAPTASGLGDTGLAGKGIVAQADGAASQLSGQNGLGAVTPYNDTAGSNISAGAAQADTSLRDSLKSKLLASEAGAGGDGGAEAGGLAAADAEQSKDPKAKQAAANEARMAQVLAPEASVVPGFVMTGSETDEAVKNLLAGFDEKDKVEAAGEIGTAGGDGRGLASEQSAPPGVEGRDSTNLFARVRAKVVRCVKKGYVTNGITNKQI